jgi:hypothetical protein
MGITLARRMGVSSPIGLASTVVGASLPDIDVLVSLALHRDPWKLHRKGTHTLGFATTAGMLAGFTGLVSAGNAEGERDLVADALTGAIIIASHVIMDNTPFPYLPTKKKMPRNARIRNVVGNWLLDAAVYGYIAYRFRPRARASNA